MSNLKKILLLVAIINVLIIIDAAGYMLIERANFIDSLYMTVITITTVVTGVMVIAISRTVF